MEFERLFEETSDSGSTMDEESIELEIVNPIAEAMPEGYWYASKDEDESGNLIYEFLSNKGPRVEIRIEMNRNN